MVSETGNNGSTTPIDSGGAQSALDLSNERDLGAIRRAIARWPKRWRGLTDDRKDRLLAQLNAAGEIAYQCLDDPNQALDAAKTVASIAKTMAVMEGQEQKDQHAILERMAPSLHAHEHTVEVIHTNRMRPALED